MNLNSIRDRGEGLFCEGAKKLPFLGFTLSPLWTGNICTNAFGRIGAQAWRDEQWS